MARRNPLTRLDLKTKRRFFESDCRLGYLAYDSNGGRHALRDLNINDVEYIGGEWRIQNKAPENMKEIQGRHVVLGERIPGPKNSFFEFYNAQLVSVSCYGYYVLKEPKIVVAKYETDEHIYWSYSVTLEFAQSAIEVCMYKKYRDLIHCTACENKLKNYQK